MSRQIEAVIFDWAGTTVDYGCFAPVEAFRQAFAEEGIDATTEEIRRPMGLSKRLHVRTMFEMPRIAARWQDTHGRPWTEADVEQVYRRSEERILSLLPDYAEPIAHVLDAVAQLRERGIQIGSTTGYNDEMMSLVVPAAAAAGYRPDCWFSADATRQIGRPYPYMIFRALETLRVSSVGAAVKVGDTVADIQDHRGGDRGQLPAGALPAGIRKPGAGTAAGGNRPGAPSIRRLRRRLCDRQHERAARPAGSSFGSNSLTADKINPDDI